ncbi:MAG: hypothetical protein AB7S26_04290 [Sandaracinaceae bacterium]
MSLTRIRPALSFAAILLATACGPTSLSMGDHGTTLDLGGDASRRVRELTDLEEVRGVVLQGANVYVATDVGLLRYPAGDNIGRTVDGLPSEDVHGVVADGEAVLAAAGDALVSVQGDAVTVVPGAPHIGHLTDMATTADGTIWLCGLGGLARRGRGQQQWEIFGEPIRCTTLAPTPEGQLWVGTHQGIYYIEDDVIREHALSGGIPEGYVRDIVPVLPGQIMALVQGPSTSQIAYWDGTSWYGYTISGLDEPLVALVRRGGQVLLLSEHRMLAIGPRGGGVALTPLSAQEGQVRSFRGRIQLASEHQPGELPTRDVLAEPMRLAPVPDHDNGVSAPEFKARILPQALPGAAYTAFVQGSDAFIAIANQGLLHLSGGGAERTLRSRSLVPEADELQVASDPSGTVWTIARGNRLAKFVGGRLRRTNVPDGLVVSAVAPGERGAYLATTVAEQPNVVRIFVNTGNGWTPGFERTLEVPNLVSIPFMGVAPDGKVWLALRVRRDDSDGTRMRGVAVLDPNDEAIVYHHRGAEQASGGLPLPDEISTIDFDTENAWFGTLSGLVRVGASQAVVFGESRGVRGEVVTDAVVGNDVIWLTAAEGLGSYDRSNFTFAYPANVQELRPTHVAMDLSGHLWVGSTRGLAMHEGTSDWLILDEDDGLPASDIRDIEVDSAGRVWILATEQLVVLQR